MRDICVFLSESTSLGDLLAHRLHSFITMIDNVKAAKKIVY